MYIHSMASFGYVLKVNMACRLFIESRILQNVSPTCINRYMVSWHWPRNVISGIVKKWKQTYVNSYNTYLIYKATYIPSHKECNKERTSFPSEMATICFRCHQTGGNANLHVNMSLHVEQDAIES